MAAAPTENDTITAPHEEPDNVMSSTFKQCLKRHHIFAPDEAPILGEFTKNYNI